MDASFHHRHRWLSLTVLCLGVTLIVLDSTVVNVALPSIRADLGFSETSLVWPINAYVLTFGGFLLLGGRLGDLYGPRRLFLAGIAVFTLASLACGLATAQAPLIWARAAQGVGAAIVDAVSLSIIMRLFTEPGDRGKAMGVYGFICSAGGIIGVLLGGLITTSLSWHWVFLINLPLGIIVYALCSILIPAAATDELQTSRQLDVFGALTITASLMLIVYGILRSNESGSTSMQSALALLAAVVLLAAFLRIESRIRFPLVPFRIFRSRSFVIANLAAALWSAASFAWFFVCALYLQRVLGKSAMDVALAFLPANLLMAVLSLGVSARIVSYFGIRTPLVAGMLLSALGLGLLARAPVSGDALTDVLPGMLLLGAGSGISFNPLLLLALRDVDAQDSGLASGLFNTSSLMGGSIGLAILACIAAAWTRRLSSEGVDPLEALNGGYRAAFAAGALCAAAAAALGGNAGTESRAETAAGSALEGE